jgi:mono/diheme cytochrome c family protein
MGRNPKGKRLGVTIMLGSFALCLLIARGAAAAGDAQAGAQLYKAHKCSLCHGEGGKGDGPVFKGKPDDPMQDWTNKNTMSGLTDDFLAEIITKGGKAVGKSPKMIAYGEKLSDDQVKDLVAYIRSLAQ